MIYVLFGPPGVGKTYIGQLLSRTYELPFFDADILIDAEEFQLLQSGEYDQAARDVFVEKLIKHVESLIESNGFTQDLIIAEAFTKERNRLNFMKKFEGNVCYIMVDTPPNLAWKRAKERIKISRKLHVINEKAFHQIWSEFEEPKLLYMVLKNNSSDDDTIVAEFGNLITLLKRGR